MKNKLKLFRVECIDSIEYIRAYNKKQIYNAYYRLYKKNKSDLISVEEIDYEAILPLDVSYITREVLYSL